MDVKTQAATEYLMIVGFVIVILIPGIYLYVKYSSESQDSITNAKIDAISSEIVKATDLVYSYGDGSQTTVSVDLPQNVVMIEFEGKEIIFTVINSKGSQSEIAKVANVELVGEINVIPGTKKITVKSLGNAVSVYVECSDDDLRCGTQYECNYYIEGSTEGQECVMKCGNNRWELKNPQTTGEGHGICANGPLTYEDCVEDQCVPEDQE